MKKSRSREIRRWAAACLMGLAVFSLAACGGEENPTNLISQNEGSKQVVNLFSPMEKTDPNAENAARNALDLTVAMAESSLGVTVAYNTYTAENYQEKTASRPPV